MVLGTRILRWKRCSVRGVLLVSIFIRCEDGFGVWEKVGDYTRSWFCGV
jgi:hypothetical protein